MPMIANGETMHKVVLLGPRGAATHLLEHRPREWKAEKWWRSDGQGEPGEPPMDGASFNESFTADGAKHRAYFFAHGISVDDFDRLGPETKAALFKRMDHLVLVLDASSSVIAQAVSEEFVESRPPVTAVGILGCTTRAVNWEGRALPVTLLADTDISGWMTDFLLRLAKVEAPKQLEPGLASSQEIAIIVSANLERVQMAEPMSPWEVLLSPIWEPGPNGDDPGVVEREADVLGTRL